MDDPETKLAWAKNHLELLYREIAQFAENPYAVMREDDLEHGCHILRLQLFDVPRRISLIAGDAVYNMRASLDQLAWSLARPGGIPKRVAFPIIDGPALTKERLDSFKRSLAGVPSEAICEIDFLQPYHRGAHYKTHPLWRLDELCNLDKHRRIPANGSIAVLNFPNLAPGDPASTMMAVTTTDEGFVVRIPIALKNKLDGYKTQAFEVMFGGDASGISEHFRGLIQIYKFIAEDVLPLFARFLT
jgi:hypothetical protein